MAGIIFHLQSPPTSVEVDTMEFYLSNSFNPPALAVMNEDLEEIRVSGGTEVDYTLLEDIDIEYADTTLGVASYTPPLGTRALLVECWGGGGGGGGCATAATNAAAGGGGGGGAYSKVWSTSNVMGAHGVFVGNGGAGGAAGANAGSAGEDTQFEDTLGSAICLAKGGAGGHADTVAAAHVGGNAANGGAASSGTGDLKQQGHAGCIGMTFAAALAVSGRGGAGMLGGSGAASRSTQGAGTNAEGIGGGGSGGLILSGGASVAGGNGAPGLVRIRAYG